MIEGFAHLRKIYSQADITLLSELAKADRHDLVAPTHLVKKGSEVVGYMSIANIPVVLAWLSTKEMKARDSFGIINVAEQLIELTGWKSMLMPVDDESPFKPLMEKMGYKNLTKLNMYAKEFYAR